MNLDAQVLRKERAVGIIPVEGKRFAREQLEETVLVTQKILAGFCLTHVLRKVRLTSIAGILISRPSHTILRLQR